VNDVRLVRGPCRQSVCSAAGAHVAGSCQCQFPDGEISVTYIAHVSAGDQVNTAHTAADSGQHQAAPRLSGSKITRRRFRAARFNQSCEWWSFHVHHHSRSIPAVKSFPFAFQNYTRVRRVVHPIGTPGESPATCRSFMAAFSGRSRRTVAFHARSGSVRVILWGGRLRRCAEVSVAFSLAGAGSACGGSRPVCPLWLACQHPRPAACRLNQVQW
jgi:hypothetical protein